MMKHIAILTVLFLLIFINGCQKEDDTSSTLEKKISLEIIISHFPAEIKEVMESSKQQTTDAIKRTLDHPEEVFFIDSQLITELKQREKDVVPRLLKIMAEKKFSKAGITAAIILIKMGNNQGIETLLEVLQKGEAQAKLEVLQKLGNLESQGLILKEKFSPALISALDSPDIKIKDEAVEACGILKVQGVASKFLQLLNSDIPINKGRICYWLSVNYPSLSNLEQVRRYFFSGCKDLDTYWLISAFESFSNSKNREIAGKAVAVVEEYLKNVKKFDLTLGAAVNIVATKGSEASADTLRNILDNPKFPFYTRGFALEGLVRIKGIKAMDMIETHLNNPETQTYAIKAYGSLKKNSGNIGDLEFLDKIASKAGEPYLIGTVTEAMLAVGGDQAAERAARYVDKLDPNTRMKIMWKIKGFQLEQVLTKMKTLGLIKSFSIDKVVEKLEADEIDDYDDTVVLSRIFENNRILLNFDVETGEIPSRHDQLILDFSAASNSVFTPVYADQIWHQKNEADYDAHYTVRFVYDNILYKFNARNLGDWYDVEQVVKAINFALKNAGKKERFFQLYSGGQDAYFLFGNGEVIKQLADEFYLPLEANLEAPMKQGKEFEQRVIKELNKKGAVRANVQTCFGFIDR
jgi:hypothetical protein